MKSTSVARVLLLVPIVLISLSLAISVFLYPGSGTFHADTYYLPLREYVEEAKRRSMEEEVIRIYNEEQRSRLRVLIMRDVICLGSLLLARFLLSRPLADAGDEMDASRRQEELKEELKGTGVN